MNGRGIEGEMRYGSDKRYPAPEPKRTVETERGGRETDGIEGGRGN